MRFCVIGHANAGIELYRKYFNCDFVVQPPLSTNTLLGFDAIWLIYTIVIYENNLFLSFSSSNPKLPRSGEIISSKSNLELANTTSLRG